jgi:NAD(P)H-dependent FMN reductase
MVLGMSVTERPLTIAVILGSTREGRFGPVVARWFAERARSRPDLSVDLVDLAELDLPAAYPQVAGPELGDYLSRIGRADGFVVVTPEYNHGYPAALKQAIDLPRHEWQAKPVAFVSYGGLSGGLRAVEQLRQVFAELHATTVRDTVSFHMAHGAFDASGQPIEPKGCTAAAEVLLDQLAWWAGALRTARHTRAYPA